MHTVGVNLIANQDINFCGIKINVHHIRSIVVDDEFIVNILLWADEILQMIEDGVLEYSYMRDIRIVSELKEFGYSWILNINEENERKKYIKRLTNGKDI